MVTVEHLQFFIIISVCSGEFQYYLDGYCKDDTFWTQLLV